MKKIFVFSSMFVFVSIGAMLVSCSPDDDNDSHSSLITTTTTTTQKVTAPKFDKYLTTTDLDGFSIRVRFKTGGDKENNLSATVYWKNYSKKPSTTPTKKELTKVESMRQYGSAVYHNTGSEKGMTESIVFDKSHAGYNGGTYIYYYVECKNSVGSANSSISYTIVKR